MYCKHCGSQIEVDSLFCHKCGCSIENSVLENQTKINASIIPKKDHLANVSLIFAILSLLLQISLVIHLVDSSAPDYLFFFVFVGSFAFLPAIILSIVALIGVLMKLKKLPKDQRRVKGLKRRIISFCIAVVLPLILISLRTPLSYTHAVSQYKNGDYLNAAKNFENMDYGKSRELADECYYIEGVDSAKECCFDDALSALGKVSNQDYRATKQLRFYCHVASSAFNNAEKDLTTRLKNPGSYNRYSATYHSASLSDSTVDRFFIDVSVSIKYSATNSYGGRITDVYNYNGEIPIVNSYKFTKEEAKTILSKSVDQIIEDYDN